MIHFCSTTFFRRTAGGVVVAFFLCGAAAILAFVAGCGGGNAPAASGGAKTGRGKATVTLEWPAPSRLIPVAAQSVRVAVATPQGQELGARTLVRPPAGGMTTATFADLPVGTLYVSATAYPASDGFYQGAALAFAISPVTVQSGLNSPVALVMNSEISRLQINPVSWSPGGVGERQQFNLQALNATNQTVMTAPTRIKWESSDPSVLAVDDNGAAVAIKAGSATLTVTETESGKQIAVPVTVGSPAGNAAYRIVALKTNDIIYNPVNRKLYATLPSVAAANGNSVVTIDPETGTIGAAVFVGSEPGPMALSDDGASLYVGLRGAQKIVRVNTGTNSVDQQFALRLPNADPNANPQEYYAQRIAVQPGNPNVIAVSLQGGQSYFNHQGVVIYENGTPRPNVTSANPPNGVIVWAVGNPERVYGFDSSGYSGGFSRLTVDANGISVLDTHGSYDNNLLAGSSDVVSAGGYIYGTSGRVIDPERYELIGTCQANGPVAPAPELVRIYYAQAYYDYQNGGGYTVSVDAFDSYTFVPVAKLILTGLGTPNNPLTKLVRWGQKGLVVQASDNIALIPNAPEVVPPAPPQ